MAAKVNRNCSPLPSPDMEIRKHLLITGTALKRWFLAQTYDALAVGLLWLVGLLLLDVPLALLWALLGTMLQFVPQIGTVLALVGPAATAGISQGLDGLLYVGILYALIVAIDGFLLQPNIMKRTARIPVWASILTPLVLGVFLNVWGVVLSIPLLAVIYAYRERAARSNSIMGA
jgi:predicted PurR-regulated permease PerM